jgi:hypothetical protein
VTAGEAERAKRPRWAEFLAKRPFLLLPALGTMLLGPMLVLVVRVRIQEHHQRKVTAGRIAIIEEGLGDRVKDAQLDRDVACGLAQMHVLEHGCRGHSGYELDDFRCDGYLHNAESHRAQLDLFSFATSTTSHVELTFNVCFRRDARWYVTTLRDSGECP